MFIERQKARKERSVRDDKGDSLPNDRRISKCNEGKLKEIRRIKTSETATGFCNPGRYA